MRRRVKVDVTWSDIVKGKKNDACACPIGLAAMRAGLEQPVVTHELEFLHDGERFVVDLPVKARQFIGRFDHYALIKPFSFWVTIG